MKRNEMDLHVGNEIVDTLTESIKQIDTLIATSVQLEKTGTKEEVFLFADHSSQFVTNTQMNLRSLRDLYDISTYLQFETATFFPVDSFKIPSERIEEAKKQLNRLHNALSGSLPTTRGKSSWRCSHVPARLTAMSRILNCAKRGPRIGPSNGR